jgi:hypothetical protein
MVAELAAVKFWAGERDTVVREAFAAGLTKQQIHQFSGVARTTIDRILSGLRPWKR